MISTTIPLTLSLSVALGLYLLAAGLGLLRMGDRVAQLIDEFERSPALTLITGVVAYGLGTAIILTHRVWTDPLAVVVSLIGWIAAIEGLLLIAWPAPLWSLGRAMLRGSGARISLLVTLVLGLLLALLGLTGTAGRV
jgi:uncharacterized membrane protein